MNIAIIDVGSNNIKLEIFEIRNDGNAIILFEEKFPARLGHDVFITGKLNQANIENAIESLKQADRLIHQFNCRKTIALGTAAVRECDSSEFVAAAKKQARIAIRVISGIEEARLVYSGVKAHTDLKNGIYFLNDIGGGSTEISVCNDQTIYFTESLRLGTVRLHEMFAHENADIAPLVEKYTRKTLEAYLPEIKKQKIDFGLSTGGTARTILEILRQNGYPIFEHNHLPGFQTKDLRKLVDEMRKMAGKDLVKIKGLDIQRSDIIVPGAALLLSLLQECELEQNLVSPKGLRDGALADYIFRKVNKNIYYRNQTDYREQGLRFLLNKFLVEPRHAEQTARLALSFFDQLKNTHGLTDEYRDLLYAASLLHDCGKYIDYSQHHKHSMYLILNAKMPGFTESEKQIIAHTARYHRKSLPKASHIEFYALGVREQGVIIRMSALLRLADALDRGYMNAVKDVRIVNEGKEEIELKISGKTDLSLELWSVERKKQAFENTFRKKLVITTEIS
jgi:exopolyphosphatase/guanosine-5'-triphosphate,3'-diphosphate pyrophosphatase